MFLRHKLVFGHGTDNAWDEAVAIARNILQLPASADRSLLQRRLNVSEVKRLVTVAQQRATTHKPVPYLVNEAWFAQEKYYIDERAIIPRSPFAELIKRQFQPYLSIANDISSSGANAKMLRILDLATGSGCIAIACSKEFPAAQIDAVDISSDVLEVAKINVKLHDCAAQVRLLQSDLFASLSQDAPYDVIVSNPPYVPQQAAQHIPYEYKFEPELALYSGEDGLVCAKRILAQAAQFLTASGLLFLEVGTSWRVLQRQYPQIPFTWVDLAHGGEGILVFTKDELVEYQWLFRSYSSNN